MPAIGVETPEEQFSIAEKVEPDAVSGVFDAWNGAARVESGVEKAEVGAVSN